MSAPTYHIATGIGGSTGATSALISSGSTTGDLLIAFCQVGLTGSGSVTFSCTNGWTIGDTINLGGNLGSVCWAYKVAIGGSGDDTTFTWGGATLSWHGQRVDFAGQSATNYIGQKNSASAVSSTTLTAAPLNLLHSASLVFALLFVMSASETISLPASYTNIAVYADGFGSDRLCYEIPTGSTSDAISESISSNNWASFAIEVRSSGLPAARQNNHSHIIG